jgi:osmotically-inducible protein OsmY
LRYATKVLFLVLSWSYLTAAADQQPDDASINFWVTRALSEDARIASPGISLTTSGGVVTLAGTAANLVQKNYAELEAKKIKGVVGVVNTIVVAPVSRPDIEIRQTIRRRIINSSVIYSESLGVEVKSGLVILTGTVLSYSEKQEISLLAGEVRGVTSVDNRISVNYVFKRPDAEIASDVQAKLARDVYLSGLSVAVSVQNGIAVLSGDVGNLYEKDRAAVDAIQVSNVSDVKNNLRVMWWAITGVRAKPPTPTDSVLTRWVSEELNTDLRITKPWEIVAGAKGGHVTLWGRLPTFRQKLLAQQDAADVVGVAWVSNLIAVKGPWRDDLSLYEDVHFALTSDDALSSDNITAFINDGVVTLSGTVNTEYEKSQAQKDVSGTLGVQYIVDNITVNWQARDLDNAIKERIEDRLARNGVTWPLASKISVDVRSGTAILSGQVDSWAQYTEATQIAFRTIGVRSIDNRLLVKGANYEWNKFRSSPPDVTGEPKYTDQWRYFPYYR